LTSRLNRPTFNRISGASRVASSCVGHALYTTHERPFFFNQPISTDKNFFRFEVSNRDHAKLYPTILLWALDGHS
jgi:hypothetical protein